jgi:hypothetical protein
MADKERNPAVLIPYSGVSEDPAEQDIFVYLRPESNGVLVESAMLKVIERNPGYKKRLFLAYLANLPGEFIIRNRITEDHYPIKLKFAALGAKLFTPAMKKCFSREFGVDFSSAKILGSFTALVVLGMSPEELFNFWVSEKDIIITNDQTIKKIGEYYVVNCDIPHLVHMRYEDKNIAVMIFRTRMNYREFREIVNEMEDALLEAKILLPQRPSSRVFHYSKGPFEQVLDGLGYLYTPEAVHIPLSDLPFPRFLTSRGIGFPVLWGLIQNPIVRYTDAQGAPREDSLYNYTREDSYEEARKKILSITAQVFLPLGKEDQEVLDKSVQRKTQGTV